MHIYLHGCTSPYSVRVRTPSLQHTSGCDESQAANDYLCQRHRSAPCWVVTWSELSTTFPGKQSLSKWVRLHGPGFVVFFSAGATLSAWMDEALEPRPSAGLSRFPHRHLKMAVHPSHIKGWHSGGWSIHWTGTLQGRRSLVAVLAGWSSGSLWAAALA